MRTIVEAVDEGTCFFFQLCLDGVIRLDVDYRFCCTKHKTSVTINSLVIGLKDKEKKRYNSPIQESAALIL